MNRRENEDRIARALRNQLSDAEKERWEELLRADSSLRDEFVEESALQRALDALPNVPISSNFTSLVVQAATSEARPHSSWRFRWPIVRLAFGSAALLVLGSTALVNYRNHHLRQEEMALNVRSFSEFTSAVTSSKTAPEEVLQNFEAIERLSLPADGELDMELLVALQK